MGKVSGIVKICIVDDPVADAENLTGGSDVDSENDHMDDLLGICLYQAVCDAPNLTPNPTSTSSSLP